MPESRHPRDHGKIDAAIFEIHEDVHTEIEPAPLIVFHPPVHTPHHGCIR